MNRNQNLQLMQRVTMDVFEVYGYKYSIKILDALSDKLDYDHDIFVEYARDAYESVLEGYVVE
ncbi:hypothetical protein EX461_23955 [Vibrio parahaemolyticus]|nr:hypothetical protein [Vibrio parahaemolyticus]EJG0013987.1 hypothetical protein [Vibrio parahaemolyticus]EJG0782028.1 hypothetical protein [Vibrio parahaemolyticus]EJS9799238.1 hypothetical protein [Vibrio parahaemolyticus]